jgi:hypothetical protein
VSKLNEIFNCHLLELFATLKMLKILPSGNNIFLITVLDFARKVNINVSKRFPSYLVASVLLIKAEMPSVSDHSHQSIEGMRFLRNPLKS